MDLSLKKVVVTGGGTGIGRGIAAALAREGAAVAIGGRRLEPLQSTAAGAAGRIIYHLLDVADRAGVERFFAWSERELGRIDILVNAAGINIRRRALAELSPEDWDRLLAVNATGAFNCMHAVLPGMRRRGDGLIINISSTAGKRSNPLGGAAYSAAKFAMSALGTCAALEDGRNGIRVTNIYPGEVDTPILEQRPVPLSAEHRARILQPEDIAAAVVMIAKLPPRAHVAELVIKPTLQDYS